MKKVFSDNKAENIKANLTRKVNPDCFRVENLKIKGLNVVKPRGRRGRTKRAA